MRANGLFDANSNPDVSAVPTVPSPCINVCRMTADRSHCEGCFRTLEEIRAWRGLDDAGKRAVWAAIAQRSGGRHTLAQPLPPVPSASPASPVPPPKESAP
ncbi:MAG: DUF1289 domain-containing protein [Pseudomonadota bacterium]|nr:DUF1289 domain-containing protein [Pseudomonadota bacterium]